MIRICATIYFLFYQIAHRLLNLLCFRSFSKHFSLLRLFRISSLHISLCFNGILFYTWCFQLLALFHSILSDRYQLLLLSLNISSHDIRWSLSALFYQISISRIFGLRPQHSQSSSSWLFLFEGQYKEDSIGHELCLQSSQNTCPTIFH